MTAAAVAAPKAGTSYADRRHALRAVTAERLAHRELNGHQDDAVLARRVDRWLAMIRHGWSAELRSLRWEDYVEAVRERDGVATGVIHWSEVEPALVGPDRSEQAHQIACQRFDDALAALIGAPSSLTGV